MTVYFRLLPCLFVCLFKEEMLHGNVLLVTNSVKALLAFHVTHRFSGSQMDPD